MVVNRVGSTCRHDGELRGRVAVEEAESCEGGGTMVARAAAAAQQQQGQQGRY